MTTPRKSRELADRVEVAVAAFNALTPTEKNTHRQAQRESYIRGMTTPCEHGVLDFEQCGECRAQIKEPTDAE